MSRVTRAVVNPIYRHFMPLSKDLQFHTPLQQYGAQYFQIKMKQYLIQGAYPIDSTIISRADNRPTGQFQGGYRCTLEILSQPVHGVVRIGDDKLCFEYRPESQYRGGDAFSYRIVNSMGQGSNVSCISLFVRV